MIRVLVLLFALLSTAHAQTNLPPERFDIFMGGLPHATTPLVGTEPMIVLQGGITKQVPANSFSGATNSVINAGLYLKCDNTTDDTANWATMLAAVPNDSGVTIQFPVGCVSLAHGISFNGKSGIRFQGATATVGGANVGQPIIRYNGSAGGMLITCTPCANIYIEGISFDLNNLADAGFQAVWSNSPFVTQTVQFRRVSFYANAASGGTGRTNAKLLDWCSTGATSNCEQLIVEDSLFDGSGTLSNSTCIYIGHANAVINQVTGVFTVFCGTGINVKGESRLVSSIGESNGVDINCGANEPVEISMFRSEASNQFFTGACPVYLHDNRIADSGAVCSVNFSGVSGTVLFMNNQFNSNDTLAPFCTPLAEFVISYGNQYPTAAISGGQVTAFATANVPYFISFLDQAGGTAVRSEVANTFYCSNIQPANPVTVQGCVGVVKTQSGGSGSSGLLGLLNGSGSGAAIRGSSAGLGNAGLITEADMFAADFSNSAMVGNGTTAIGFHAITPSGTVGTWTNIYGVKIDKMCNANISNCWGINQVDAGDTNVFNGGTQFGATTLSVAKGEVGLGKIAATGVAAGAAGGKIELVCGTNAGSAKLIAYAGTSTTPVTILDNIGSGVTGC